MNVTMTSRLATSTVATERPRWAESEQSSQFDSTERPDATDSPPTAEERLGELEAWIARIADVCEQAARGNLERRLLHVDVDGDLARVIHSINGLLDYTDAFVRESRASLEAAAHGKFYRRVLLRGMQGSFLHASKVINEASEEMQRKSLAIDKSHAERLAMADDFEHSVREVTTAVAQSASEMHGTSSELSEVTQRTSRQADATLSITEQTSQNVERVADSTEQLAGAISKINSQVQESAVIAQRAVDEVSKARAVVAGLHSSSSNIDTVVETLAAIAKRTDLLALNAAIEAARAGEAGAGFAIVAAEVRKLAEQACDATEHAKNEVACVQVGASRSSDCINAFANTVAELDAISNSIAQLVDQQSRETAQIHENASQALQRTREVVSKMQEASQDAAETCESAEKLVGASALLSDHAKTLSKSAESFLGSIRGE